MHPIISKQTTTFLEKFGQVMFTKVVKAENTLIAVLPTLPKYIKDGKNSLCYNFVLCQCLGQHCMFHNGHAPAANVTDDFELAVCIAVKLGLDYIMANGVAVGASENAMNEEYNGERPLSIVGFGTTPDQLQGCSCLNGI